MITTNENADKAVAHLMQIGDQLSNTKAERIQFLNGCLASAATCNAPQIAERLQAALNEHTTNESTLKVRFG